jgi:hypothetical protein
MTKTDVKRLQFTPVLDSLMAEVGLVNAAVFGRVWRYCQMGRGYCHAEQERIADNLGISRKTVNVALGVLVAGGYLADTTPNTRGRTRIYKDTGKAGMSRFSDIGEDDTEPVTEPVTEVVTEVVTEPVTEVVTKSYTKTHKTEKTEKTEKTHTHGAGVFFSSFENISKERQDKNKGASIENTFLETASEEQKRAYELVRKVASVDKAIEKAESGYPLQAACDYIEWSANHGGKIADIILSGLIQSGEYVPKPAVRRNARAEEIMKAKSVMQKIIDGEA